ncbi:MAG: SpoIIE family protein phosphatase [Firmicutes bacterium]|nr:SpoIIE family protein phosphatase [Bacillota bacterium]
MGANRKKKVGSKPQKVNMYRKAGSDLCQSAASPARQLRERGRAAGGIDIRVGYAAAAAAGISGDAAVSCGLPGGSRALILSDGMGKGIKAAAGSRLVVTRLRRNLKAGMPVAAAIKEVNRYMIEQAEGADMSEEFATVDLTVIDRQSRRARFYKMGAATSFIMRGGRVRKIKGTALPVGIIPKLRLTHISAVLKEGDLIVMVSDGITDADRNDLEARWLCDYLSEEIYSADFDTGRMSARQIAADILAEAEARYVGRERDDLTVAAALIVNGGTDGAKE